MRVLVLSEIISSMQATSKSPYYPPPDVQLDMGDMSKRENFTFSVFDYDVSIVHIQEPGSFFSYSKMGYYNNLPKLLQDSSLALEHGHTVICLPNSRNFISESMDQRRGMSAYEWLEELGVELRDNEGEAIKPSGAGRAQVIKEYLKYAPKYYQIVTKPITAPSSRLAVVDDTDIVVGLELQVGRGTLVILPPPTLDDNNFGNYPLTSSRYYEIKGWLNPFYDFPNWY